MKPSKSAWAILSAALLSQCAAPRKPLGLNPVLSERRYLPRDSAQAKADWYTYILLAGPPVSAEDTSRYLALHAAFRKVFRTRALRLTDSAEGYYLNLAYWLLTESPGSSPDSLPDSFFVSRYDYGRAADFLERLEDYPQRDGPRPGMFVIFEDDSLLNRRDLHWRSLFHFDMTHLHPSRYEKDLTWLKGNIHENSNWKLAWRAWKSRINQVLELQGLGPETGRR